MFDDERERERERDRWEDRDKDSSPASNDRGFMLPRFGGLNALLLKPYSLSNGL